jgi:type II secretory pathway pseudopilin PulG
MIVGELTGRLRQWDGLPIRPTQCARGVRIRTCDGLPIRPAQQARRKGITLTEILIAIMILGVGMVSLASLFPLGLLRLRDATRYTRSAYLTESAQCDATARSLFNTNSFPIADSYNIPNGLAPWYGAFVNNNLTTWSPLTQDTAYYGDYATDPNNPGASSGTTGGYGLPFAYDPLWRFQTPGGSGSPTGYYLGDTFEARFASGIGFLRGDTSGGGTLPSAHGLQRLTNFNGPYRTLPNGNVIPVMLWASAVPSIFVSPEDVVLPENVAASATSPILPDLNLKFSPGTTANDFRFTWMFTGNQVSGTGGSSFDGNVVIFENRPFAIDAAPHAPGPSVTPVYQVAGETVVEAIWGHGANIVGGYATGADRTVLLRWYASQADPVVRPGDWIADVTYERQSLVIYNAQNASGRFLVGNPQIGILNPFNNNEWDNTPAQRCFWYQVQKVVPAMDDPYTVGNAQLMRSMVVYVDRTLQSRTLLSAAGTPMGADGAAGGLNAALICPYVVNAFQQQFTVR